MKLTARNFLARAQRFVVRPAPGWADVTLDEVRTVLHTPYSKYKFEPAFLNNAAMLNADGNIEILNCDYRQGMELTTRLMTAHDVQWVVEDLQCKEHKDIKRACFQFPFAIFMKPTHSLSEARIDVRAHASGSFADSSKMLKDFFFEGLDTFGRSNGDAETSNAPLRSRKKLSVFDAPVDQFDVSQKYLFTMKLHNGRLTIAANLCGEPLYKRGFKQQALGAAAPLPEHHAAAAYYWAHNSVFPDNNSDSKRSADTPDSPVFHSPIEHPDTVHIPFAGTGTLGIETLSLMLGACPGSHSDRHFLVSNFNQTPVSTMEFIRKRNRTAGVSSSSEASAAKPGSGAISLATDEDMYAWSKDIVTRFSFSDIDARAIQSTRENVESFVASVAAKQTGSEGGKRSTVLCTFDTMDFLAPGASNRALVGGEGGKLHHHCVLLNPPFGKRLDTSVSPVETYRQLSRAVQAMRYSSNNKTLRKDIKVSGYCLCPDEATWKAFSSNKFANLFSCKTRHFTHGGIDMRVIAFTSKA